MKTECSNAFEKYTVEYVSKLLETSGGGEAEMNISQGRCLLIPKYFCAVYDYVGRTDLSKAYWNPKRKLGITTHFLVII